MTVTIPDPVEGDVYVLCTVGHDNDELVDAGWTFVSCDLQAQVWYRTDPPPWQP